MIVSNFQKNLFNNNKTILNIFQNPLNKISKTNFNNNNNKIKKIILQTDQVTHKK